ncbi:TPA: ATP-grasp domain-containing protein [Pseudomonas putida]|nr:ATP-grasp domain-containing protein [Pseudomonas putida]HEN8716946.1 ATP-grasp domain-containing protein [Pseudomonas putida]
MLRLDLAKFTRVFLALHGGFGENGMAQAYLEGQGIPYNGPSPQTSAICMNKLLTKHIAMGLGINVANYLYSRRGDDLCVEKINEQLGTPCIVKPNREGCSFGVSLVRDLETDLQDAINAAAQFHTGVLVEEFISGPELSVCYFNKATLPIYSLAFESEFFSYEAKFISSKTTATLTTLDRTTHQQLNNYCFAIAEALELDYFRADFIIHNTEPYLIELNTLPGLTSHSLFPKACQQHGIEFDKLVLLLNNLEPSQYC